MSCCFASTRLLASCLLLALPLLLSLLPSSHSVWTGFDLVRNRLHAFGSNGTTSFIKITATSVCRQSITYSCTPFNITSWNKESNFGYAVANIGDLDGDGHDDIAVGAPGDNIDYGGDIGLQQAVGSVYILFMNENATVNNVTRISGNISNGPVVYANDQFGYSIAALGDLDGDNIVDIVVGAPGYIISSAYILFMHANGTVREHRLIRGAYHGAIPPGYNASSYSYSIKENYTYNGPPITYGCRFGVSLVAIGDLDGDNTTELAIGQVDPSTGLSNVYILFLYGNGTMKSYTTISAGVGGGPDISKTFTGFGSSLMSFPDLNNDTVPELVIGAPFLYEAELLNVDAGTVFVLFMTKQGVANHSTTISQTSAKRLGVGPALPLVSYDECGSSLTMIGDINRDRYRQRRPTEPSPKRSVSIPDIIMGCPQSRSSNLPGRLFFLFLTLSGESQGYTVIPAASDAAIMANHLSPYDQFAQSLSAYVDVDKNGLKEIISGAPGDDTVTDNGGAVYIIFPRRRRHHWIPFDFLTFILLVTLTPGLFTLACIAGVVFFCWYFRRVPDEAELIVKKAGLQITPRRPRSRYSKKLGQVYAEHYEA